MPGENTQNNTLLSEYRIAHKIRQVRFSALGIAISSSLYSFFKNPSMQDLDYNSLYTSLGMLTTKLALERDLPNYALGVLGSLATDLLARSLWYRLGLSPEAAYLIASYSITLGTHLAANIVEKLEAPQIRH